MEFGEVIFWIVGGMMVLGGIGMTYVGIRDDGLRWLFMWEEGPVVNFRWLNLLSVLFSAGLSYVYFSLFYSRFIE